MQIFSLHWMMQNISILMSPRSPSGFTDIKKPNVLHHPVQAKNLQFNADFSLHWMMQNISILMSPRSPSGFTDIKKPNVLHHPVQAKNLQFNP